MRSLVHQGSRRLRRLEVSTDYHSVLVEVGLTVGCGPPALTALDGESLRLDLANDGVPQLRRSAGISVTTVRRHITAIMKRLGVSSRFAAGAAAQRRGWIA